MIIRDQHLLVLDQTIAYKNFNLQFVDFTDNLLSLVQSKNEDAILGKRDIDDLPWSIQGDDYEAHDRDALHGKTYGTLTPFSTPNEPIKIVYCIRSKCKLTDEATGILINVLPIQGNPIIHLLSLLQRGAPSSEKNYFIAKDPANIKLTTKESECLFYLLRGKSTKFIAQAMNISTRTVEFHLENIKLKFNCSTKSELISMAIQLGYINVLPPMPFQYLADRLN